MHDKKKVDYANITDKQLVESILENDADAIAYFFYSKCSGLFAYIIENIFDGKVDKRELSQELYLYLANNDWYKVRQFDFRSKLMTWISVVAIRFFQKKRQMLIESSSYSTLNDKLLNETKVNISIDNKMDLYSALNKMRNQRYRKVIESLDLNEMLPEELAQEMGIKVDNLYNIHRRALVQLRLVMGRKEDYYD